MSPAIEQSSHTMPDTSLKCSPGQNCVNQLCQQVSRGLDSMSSTADELYTQNNLVAQQPATGVMTCQPTTGLLIILPDSF